MDEEAKLSSVINLNWSYEISKIDGEDRVVLKASTWDRDGIYLSITEPGEILLSPLEAANLGRWLGVAAAECPAIKAVYDADTDKGLRAA